MAELARWLVARAVLPGATGGLVTLGLMRLGLPWGFALAVSSALGFAWGWFWGPRDG